MKRILFFVLAVALLAPGLVFAQRTTTQTAATFALTINVTPAVAGTAYFVDNVDIKGNVTAVRAGSHTIRVTAPGYREFTTTVNVTGILTVPVTLQPLTAVLTLQLQNRENISGLQYFFDAATSRNPQATLSLGNHTVRVTAPNYLEFTTTVNLTANMTVPVTLMPATAVINVTIPASLQNKGLGRDFIRQIFVYVDGTKQTLPNNSQLVIPFGQHTIRIETGGLQAEVSYNFQAGVTYTIEPVFSLTVRQ